MNTTDNQDPQEPQEAQMAQASPRNFMGIISVGDVIAMLVALASLGIAWSTQDQRITRLEEQIKAQQAATAFQGGEFDRRLTAIEGRLEKIHSLLLDELRGSWKGR
jgi:hypothetical protein